MNLDLSTIRDAVWILQSVVTLVLVIAAFYLRAIFVVRKDYEADKAVIQARLDEKQQRLDRGEARFDELTRCILALPTHAELHKFAVSVTELRGDIRELAAKLDGQRDLTERLEAAVGRHEQIFSEGRR